MDGEAFHYCNRILQNSAGSTAVEISVGGLQLQTQVDTYICLTGAPMPLTINGEVRSLWEVHRVSTGDIIRVGFATAGCRSYLGVAEGFTVAPSFGSTATVVREHIGGLRGASLENGDLLPCSAVTARKRYFLPERNQPRYQNTLTVRVIPGYQQRHFNRVEQRRFFGSTYRVSQHSDRMGYRLEGPAVACDIEGILSEGICFGAIQLPPDGQPIVLLNDRQTIGGYPKIGAALSLDAARMTQLVPGCSVHFAPITPHTAHRVLHLAQRFALNRSLQERPT
jgi:biotin-dependent carboxylase-like uncharacterized protein